MGQTELISLWLYVEVLAERGDRVVLVSEDGFIVECGETGASLRFPKLQEVSAYLRGVVDSECKKVHVTLPPVCPGIGHSY